MPALTERQRRAMAAELKRRRQGNQPKRFKSMSQRELREFAKGIKTAGVRG